jgi:hypothetical protein
VVLSDEALIAAQAKRLTKKRERKMGWRDLWREDARSSREKYPNAPEDGHDPAEMWMVRGHPAPLKSVPSTYADLYPSEYTPHDLSHTEWVHGYKGWRAMQARADWNAAEMAILRRREMALKPCFAENEI